MKAFLDGGWRLHTSVTAEGEYLAVRYKEIPVFRFAVTGSTENEDGSITEQIEVVLNTGGSDAKIIIDRMNQAFREFNIPLTAQHYAGTLIHVVWRDNRFGYYKGHSTWELVSRQNEHMSISRTTVPPPKEPEPPPKPVIDPKVMRHAEQFLGQLEKELNL